MASQNLQTSSAEAPLMNISSTEALSTNEIPLSWETLSTPETPSTDNPPAQATGLPDYVTNPNAVLGDDNAKWRYGRAPDYSNTRKIYYESRKMNHEAGSLPNLVENLVKNWEVEASFKPSIKDWRTVDHVNYTFAINGGPPQSAEHMLKVGTYNAIIAPNDFYSPEKSDFDSSHKTFKRMMPTFAWEVLEVYSGPPVVAFKWRHWGEMKNDYIGFNDKGEKIRVKSHGGPIDIQGITVAQVDNKLRLQRVETWFDPLEMFRQIAPTGEVTRTPMTADSLVAQVDTEADKLKSAPASPASSVKSVPAVRQSRFSGMMSRWFGLQTKDITPPESPPPATPIDSHPVPALSPTVSVNPETVKPLDASSPDFPLVTDTIEPNNQAAVPSTGANIAAVHGEMAGATPAHCPYLAATAGFPA